MSSFDRNKMIAQMAMLDKGVIPLPNTFMSSSKETISLIRVQLSTLSKEEQRKAKRKFRKLHRKAAKELMKEKQGLRSSRRRAEMMKTINVTMNRPTAKTHTLRNREVWSYMMRLAHEGKI